MAYENQKGNFANIMRTLADDFVSLMDRYNASKKYYNSTLQGENAIVSSDSFGNGITGEDILGVVNAFDAIELKAITDFLYTNLNKVR